MPIHQRWMTYLAIGWVFLFHSPVSVASSEFEVPSAEPKLIVFIIEAAGPVFGPVLLILQVALVTVLVLVAMELRAGTTVPPQFVKDFTDAVSRRRFKEAFELARSDTSFLGRVLTVGMGRLQYGIDDARRAADLQFDAIQANRMGLLSLVKLFSILFLLFGVFGSLWEIVLHIRLIESGPAPKVPTLGHLPFLVANDLVISMIGVTSCGVGVVCYFFCSNRATVLAAQVRQTADDLLTQMHHNARGSAGSGGGFASPGSSRSPIAYQAAAGHLSCGRVGGAVMPQELAAIRVAAFGYMPVHPAPVLQLI